MAEVCVQVPCAVPLSIGSPSPAGYATVQMTFTLVNAQVMNSSTANTTKQGIPFGIILFEEEIRQQLAERVDIAPNTLTIEQYTANPVQVKLNVQLFVSTNYTGQQTYITGDQIVTTWTNAIGATQAKGYLAYVENVQVECCDHALAEVPSKCAVCVPSVNVTDIVIGVICSTIGMLILCLMWTLWWKRRQLKKLAKMHPVVPYEEQPGHRPPPLKIIEAPDDAEIASFYRTPDMINQRLTFANNNIGSLRGNPISTRHNTPQSQSGVISPRPTRIVSPRIENAHIQHHPQHRLIYNRNDRENRPEHQLNPLNVVEAPADAVI